MIFYSTHSCYRTCFEDGACKAFEVHSSPQTLHVLVNGSGYTFQHVASPQYGEGNYRKSTNCRLVYIDTDVLLVKKETIFLKMILFWFSSIVSFTVAGTFCEAEQSRLDRAGQRVKSVSSCMKSSVTYLGHRIDADGLHP